MLFFVAGYACVIHRLYVLQIRDHESLKEKAVRQQMRTVRIVPKRGTIYDRKMRELAISVDTVSLYAVPSQVKNKAIAARKLAKITGRKRAKIHRALRKRRQFVWIARKCNPKVLGQLEQADLDGVHALFESRRFYPNRSLAAGLLGIVGMDNEGLEGIEYQYDSTVKGKPGWLLVSVDARRRKIMSQGEGAGYVKPTGGNHLVLTIDEVIQYITEEELKRTVEEHRAVSGMAVVMRPSTGEILSMASVPGFDPNRFASFRSQDRWNRPVLENFEPGSTFKLMTLSSALERGSIHKKDIFFCENGAYRLFNTVYHDTHEYGWLSVQKILQKSSNIGAIKIGERLKDADFYDSIRAFGFGEKTGVDLPGESPGVVRPVREWSGLSRASISMGQEISVTALQLVTAVASIANRGIRMRPYVISRVLSPDGKILREGRPERINRVMSRETAEFMIRCMESVITEEGTAPLAAIPGFRVAGKTGTAQKYDPSLGRYSKTRYVSSFVGFVPADHPALALIVVVNEPKGPLYYGGYVAAPAFRRIAERTLRYLRVAPGSAAKEVLFLSEGKDVPLDRVRGAG